MEDGLKSKSKEVGAIVEGVATRNWTRILVKADTAGSGPLIEDGTVVGNNCAGLVSGEVGIVSGEDLAEVVVVNIGGAEAGQSGP